MKKIINTLGLLLYFIAIIFILLHRFLVTSSPDEDFSRDFFFSLPIPHPPTWTSYVPFVGLFIGFIFELFSLHGLVGMGVFFVLISVAHFLSNYGEQN